MLVHGSFGKESQSGISEYSHLREVANQMASISFASQPPHSYLRWSGIPPPFTATPREAGEGPDWIRCTCSCSE